MTTKELIAELRHVRKAAEERGGGFDYTEYMLPRIIRLLEAGEKLQHEASLAMALLDDIILSDYHVPATAFHMSRSGLERALSAYKEAAK